MKDSCGLVSLLIVLGTVHLASPEAAASARRLYDDLMRDYNHLVRPVENNTDTLIVKLGLKLSQLLDVDEKNQIMTTNVWLDHEWTDQGLRWNPRDYDGVDMLYIPSEMLWLPDIVLYNNADGNYEVTLMTKATVYYNGTVRWGPPAIYKSSCTIDVEFFPFDEQTCKLKFGSWTYNGNQVDLRHLGYNHTVHEDNREIIEEAINLHSFYVSVEWDLMKVPAKKSNSKYPCCTEPYPDITYDIVIRRKTLFYTVNMIIPCVSISFLTVLVFYLPSDCGEKITLCISILLSLTVFFLLLAEIIPPTSLVVPLLGKYLLFTMVLVTLSVIVTVIVLNIHYRTPATHDLPEWTKKVFLDILPKFLLMRRPQFDDTYERQVHAQQCPCGSPLIQPPQDTRRRVRNGYQPRPSVEITFDNVYGRESARKHYLSIPQTVMEEGSDEEDGTPFFKMPSSLRYSPAMQQAIDGVRYIAKNLRQADEDAKICEDWKYIAMVIDRMFLWIFTLVCIIGTLKIILSAPMLFDYEKPIKQWNQTVT